ncbi:hypothetical protein HYU92_05280 [Candidatus Curtissbacteria bacterium]|nr:hypothetical protein [Candidatus Curtissbacteria bacterium]
MGVTPSFYQGNTPGQTIGEWLKSSFGLVLLIAIVGLSIYGFITWQNTGQVFGNYINVQIVELLSYANFYDGKKICTRGFYVQTPSYTILKVSLKDDEYTRSIWIYDPEYREIITRIWGDSKAVVTTICGNFASSRAGEYGIPPVWNHQLTVESFKTEGELLNEANF